MHTGARGRGQHGRREQALAADETRAAALLPSANYDDSLSTPGCLLGDAVILVACYSGCPLVIKINWTGGAPRHRVSHGHRRLSTRRVEWGRSWVR